MDIHSLTPSQARELLNVMRGIRAKANLSSFFSHMRPELMNTWHMDLLCKAIEKVAKREIKKLLINLPPQHGKSTIASMLAPPYMFGLNPNEQIIAAAHTSSLAYSFSREVQRNIDCEEYRMVFPDVRLNSKNVANDSKGNYVRTKDVFDIVGYRGRYKAAGVGGGITGMTATMGIIDDYIKSAAEASSLTIRNKLWDWYAMDFSSRLNNDSAQIILATRWHEDDIAGRLLREPSLRKGWHTIILPAICEQEGLVEGDPRKVGEALFPEKHSLERLHEQRLLSERRFQCLYQQNPKANREVLIYPDFEYDVDNQYDTLNASEILGLDYGHNDETALVGTKIDKHTKTLYVRVYIYASGHTPETLIKEMESLKIGTKPIVCDTSHGGYTKMLSQRGYRMIPTVKGAGSLWSGIQAVKTFKIVLSPYYYNVKTGAGSPVRTSYSDVNMADHAAIELGEYSWVVDGMGRATEVPAKSKDHICDAMRYPVMFHVSGRGGGGRFMEM